MVTSVSNLASALRRVFAHPAYIALGLLVSGGAVSVVALLPNRLLLVDFLRSAETTVVEKFGFIASLYLNLDAHMHPLSVVATVIIAVLLGINVALLVYYLRHRRESGKNKIGHLAGTLGLLAGLLGIGCAACGSLLIIGLLSSVGATAILALLPFAGAEFSGLGILLLLFSIQALAKRIHNPVVCPVTS